MYHGADDYMEEPRLSVWTMYLGGDEGVSFLQRELIICG